MWQRQAHANALLARNGLEGLAFGAMMQCVFSPGFVSGLYIFLHDVTICYDVKSIVHLCMDTYIYILVYIYIFFFYTCKVYI